MFDFKAAVYPKRFTVFRNNRRMLLPPDRQLSDIIETVFYRTCPIKYDCRCSSLIKPVRTELIEKNQRESEEKNRKTDTKNQHNTPFPQRSEEHTSELQSRQYLVCRLLLEKKYILYKSTLTVYK